MAKQATFDYQKKAAELEAILVRLQDAEVTISEATKLHARGAELADEIEAYLKQAENEVRAHTAENS